MTTQEMIIMYRSERSKIKLDQQLFAIPRKIDIIDSQVMYYYVGDRRRTAVDFQHEICFHLNTLYLKPMTSGQYMRFQESTTPMEWLIQENLLYPFLLFVNGYFIPWENIQIIASQERYDMLISGFTDEFFSKINPTGIINTEDVCVVSLPDSIDYMQGGFPITEKTLFAFNEDGVLVTSGTGYIVIENYEANVEILDFNPITDTTFVFADDPMYAYFPENVFIFRGEIFDHKADVQILATAMMVYNDNPPSGESIHVRVFHNTKWVTPTYDNFRKTKIDNIKSDLFATLQGGEVAPYMEKLSPVFNPPVDPNKTFEENNTAVLDYIAKYDSILFNRVYRSNKDFVELEVDYAWVMNHRDDDGNLKLPRRFQDGINFYIMVMVNGELYQYYRMHRYEYGYFYCPVQNIQDGDTIELLYFKNCHDFELTANISENEPYLRLDKTIYNEDLRVFSKYTTDDYFSFPAEAQTMFPIEYTIETSPDDSRDIRLRFNDPTYYGKDVYLASSHRFQYFVFNYDSANATGDEESPLYYSIDLQDKFYYCNDYDRYLVFFNGKRLINDMYRLILPYRSTTPFTKAMIYLCVPIGPGDRLEVFYLPHHFGDIYDDTANADLDPSGTIIIDKSKLSFSLDNQLCSVWVNAKKIPSSKIVNISSTKLQINTNLTSMKDVRVTTMISDDSIYSELKSRFQSTQSNWDETVERYADHFTLMGLNQPTITDTDTEAFPDVIPTVSIMNEIIRDWYQSNAIVDITGPFLYDYTDVDQSAVIGTDPTGNTLLGSADASESNNLNVDRPWP